MNADSVHARLLKEARKIGEDFQITLIRYLIERFLWRLACSPHRDRYILKGAMLFRLWEGLPYRTTMDLDLLRSEAMEAELLQKEMQAICAVKVEPDAVRFEPESVMVEPIRASEEYQGQRVLLTGFLGKSRTRLQIDIGMGDAPWPLPVTGEFSVLLGLPPLRITAYRRESVIAEKLEAMAVLGLSNSRIKDFFDIHHLAVRYAFEGRILAEPVTMNRYCSPVESKIPLRAFFHFGTLWISSKQTQGGCRVEPG